MAIRDVLWACPFCRTVDAIRAAAGKETCSTCSATFEPGPRAVIAGTPADEDKPRTRTVEEWEGDLPDIQDAASVRPPPTPAIVRWATRPRAVYQEGRLLGWAESFGPKTKAVVRLDDTTLSIQLEDAPEEVWALDSVVAVQPSSSSVQLRRRSGELVSLAFPGSSVRLWEVRLQRAVKTCYRVAGKGDISDFHPTIRVR